jgi:ATP:corrinoid adenosyltransferase
MTTEVRLLIITGRLLLTGILQVLKQQSHMTTEVLLHTQDKDNNRQHMTTEVLQHTQDKDNNHLLTTIGRQAHMLDKGEHQLSVGMELALGLEHLLLRRHKYPYKPDSIL